MNIEMLSPEDNGWLPISQAPKDGSRVMLTCADYAGTSGPFSPMDSHQDIVHLARWSFDNWWPYIPNNWTHWRPLPPPPTKELT